MTAEIKDVHRKGVKDAKCGEIGNHRWTRTNTDREPIHRRGRLLVSWCCFALPAVVLSACSVPQAYIDADAATYRAIAPEYKRYVRDDRTLDDFQRDVRLNTLATWRLRVKQAGGNVDK